jgi:hypothetical protein
MRWIDFAEVLGLMLLAGGVAAFDWRVGLIVAGLMLAAVAALVDYSRSRSK